MQTTLELRTTVDKYIRSLKSTSKRLYARDYWNHVSGAGAPMPKAKCSYMAAQAVRMQIADLLENKNKA
jgi:NifU-like protein involved in Fe-S cluster formation